MLTSPKGTFGRGRFEKVPRSVEHCSFVFGRIKCEDARLNLQAALGSYSKEQTKSATFVFLCFVKANELAEAA
jgi:hypothetical protein